jgi:Sec-independent protein translocase protein TatA
MFNFIKNISSTELIILASILILLFGGKAFISLARTAGQSLKEIKKIKKNVTEAIGGDDEDSEK